MKICAVVVTFNRLELLKLCVKRLLNQNRVLDEIFIINNASTDGTKEYLNSISSNKITTINLEKNIGGAGGFSRGVKLAYEKGFDYIWIMDDDTITINDSLSNMIEILNENEKIGFVCSNVLYKDNNACVMNVPKVKNIWNTHATKGLIELESASFVSILLDREAIKIVGLPIKEFFIWGDDVEFTKRITDKGFKGYMATSSVVYHYMNSNQGVDIVNENGERIDRYFYQFRNRLYTHKKKGIKFIIKYIVFVIKTIFNIILKSKKYKLKKTLVVLKGAMSGVFFNPKIEQV